jgi:hypothetical protein
MKALTIFLLCVWGVVFAMGSRKPVVKKPEVIELPPIQVTSDPGFTKITLRVEATAPQIVRITRLKDVVEKIINSDKFKVRVLGAYHKGRNGYFDSKLTTSEVYETLRKGNELGSGDDYEWDMEVGVQRARCSTLGWTYPSIKMFYFNSCNFDSRDDSGIAGTMCHEFTHKLGFSHSVKWTKDREYSVPYAIGTICAELYKEFL